MISAKDLVIGYKTGRGAAKVVHGGLTFELREGQVVCLMGLNGAGKSTLIKTICGMIPPLGGELLSSDEIGVVLTEKTNAGGLTVYDLVSLGRYRKTGFFGRLKESDHAVIRQSLEAVGIADKADSHVSELSDGERQKAFIAKALAQECPTIVLDEPTAFLDVKSRREVMELLRDLAHTSNKAILLSTHDLDLATSVADILWLLSPDAPLQSAAPDYLLQTGILQEFFR